MSNSQYFSPIDTALPEIEQQARAKRQNHAEWGIAIARLGGTIPAAELLHELQRYINGEVSIQELARNGHPPGQLNHVLQNVANREHFAN